MNKKSTQMVLGLAVVGVAIYWIFNQNKKANFVWNTKEPQKLNY